MVAYFPRKTRLVHLLHGGYRQYCSSIIGCLQPPSPRLHSLQWVVLPTDYPLPASVGSPNLLSLFCNRSAHLPLPRSIFQDIPPCVGNCVRLPIKTCIRTRKGLLIYQKRRYRSELSVCALAATASAVTFSTWSDVKRRLWMAIKRFITHSCWNTLSE